jgi:hypothetical protein
MSIVVGVLLLAGGVALFAFRHAVGDAWRAHNMRRRWAPMWLGDEWESRYGVAVGSVLMMAAGATILVADILRFAWN